MRLLAISICFVFTLNYIYGIANVSNCIQVYLLLVSFCSFFLSFFSFYDYFLLKGWHLPSSPFTARVDPRLRLGAASQWQRWAAFSACLACLVQSPVPAAPRSDLESARWSHFTLSGRQITPKRPNITGGYHKLIFWGKLFLRPKTIDKASQQQLPISSSLPSRDLSIHSFTATSPVRSDYFHQFPRLHSIP